MPSPTSPKASPLRLLIIILALWSAGLGGAAQFAKMGVPLPELEAIYPQAGAAIGWLVSLISAMGVVFGVIAGILAARLGFKQLLIVSLLAGAVLSLVQALLPAFPAMLGLRVLEGLSHLGIVVSAPTLIGTLTPPNWRAAAMTLWGTFFGVAYALTAWLGMPLVAEHGPASLFLGHGIWMAAIALLLLVLLPNTSGYGTKAPSTTLSLTGILVRHRDIYRSPSIAAAPLGWLFYTFTFISLLTVLPRVVEADHRAFVTAAMPLASIVVSLTLGVLLLRYVSAVSVIVIGFATSILLSILLIVMPPTPFICIAIFGALGLVQGASFAAIPQLNPAAEHQALANGGMAQMGNLGNMLGTPVMLAVLAGSGVATMMVLVMLCYSTGILAHSLLARRRQADRAANGG